MCPRVARSLARCWVDWVEGGRQIWRKRAGAAKLFRGNFGKVFFFFFEAAVVFFMKHLRYVSALSLSCQPVLMINVKLPDRIPVPTSLRGDER